MVITSNKRYLKEIITMLNSSPKGSVMISSFGFMISDTPLEQRFLKLCISRKAKVLVGVPDSPHPCLIKSLRYFKSKGMEVKMRRNHHLKMVSSNTQCLIGGMNLTGSGWTDAAITTRSRADILKLRKLFNSKFK